MSDIKSMFAKMQSKNDGNGIGNDAVAEITKATSKTPSKKGTIEKTYQKKSQLEHILLRPDTYIGSVEHTKEKMWIYDTDKDLMDHKEIDFVPGLYKIYDEILVNAADNKQRDKSMDCIKVEINQETNTISVWNNGKGIPVVMHKDEQMYVPTMIFGHLLTSSNYNDEEEKVTGGRNGYGAKLCNIFSTKFTVETASKEYKRLFKQTWGSNMSKASEPKIKDYFGDEFTKITFSPDLTKFKMDKLDDDIVGLMQRRAYDVAASTRGVKVFLNDKRLPVKNFKDYIDLYIKQKEDDIGNPLKVIYENVNERWEVAMTLSDVGFQQVSFVNSIATTKGGRHVDYVTDMIVKQLSEVLKKKNKGGITIKPFQIKTHMWIFINCLIVNPTFDSQTKENMTLQAKSFGSKCVLPEKFITQVSKCGIVESILTWAKFKAQNELSKVSGKKQVKLKGLPKLEDANEAGSKNALKCTLILTEGDSAKTLAVAGLSVIGRDHYGVFPLRGKILNVREATHKQIMENAEINNLTKILGLQYKKKYNNEDDMKSLRYGKVMIMTDQDQDGSHIKGLLINFIHHNWPELLHQNFLEEFITPIVKARKRKEVLSFYSLPEFEEWKANTPDNASYAIKYYKGLGTSDSVEAKEYFRDMARHRIRFRYGGQTDDDHIVLAFSRKHIEHRKEWLTNFMIESKRRKEIGLPEKYLYTKGVKHVSYTDFVNLELVLFSNADNVRSIPSLVDGLKPGSRKVIFTCFKRNDKREVKVAQLAGSVAEHSAYHHGEVSLCMTIVNLAQNHVGSNNINLLEPRGQFGTRLAGGKDSASPRYIFTKLSPLARLLIHPMDDPLLKNEYDDNKKIEPVWYIPILPIVLVNGAEGIGTGWATKIPNYNPRELVANIRKMLDGDDEVDPMTPWYKNFKGTIEDCGDQRYVVSGEVAVIGNDRLEITELPVGTWTQNYKENVMEPLLYGSEKTKPILQDYKEYNSDLTVRFVVTCLPGKLQELEEQGLHKVFKLQTVINTTSMCAFDELGCLRRFESVLEILREFFTLRLKMYEKRKNYCEGALKAESNKLTYQALFITEKCSGELVVENKKRKTIVDELIKRKYPPDPITEWKLMIKSEEDSEEAEEEEEQDQDAKKKKDDENSLPELKQFDYLLGMSMWMLTDERKNELLRQRDNKLAELKALQRKTPSDLWRADLDAFIEKLDSVEAKERAEVTELKTEVKKGPGKKKTNLQEIMPSPIGRRVLPTVSDEIKKKIYNAVKLKENKGKRGIKKENIAEDEKDEFDVMTQSKKTLKDKLGTPDEVEKKVKNRKSKDGLIQTKLNFKSKDIKGSPRKNRGKVVSSSEDENESNSDSDMSAPPLKERVVSRRAAAAKVSKYRDSSESSKSEDGDTLLDNDVNDVKPQKIDLCSESENEAPPPKNESSEDLFDSLIGKKESKSDKSSESAPSNNQLKRKPLKKRVASSSDSDFGEEIKNFSDDESDFEIKMPKKKKKKDNSDVELGAKKPQKKKNADPNLPKQPRKRAAPSKKVAKIVISDDDLDIGSHKNNTNTDFVRKETHKVSSDDSDLGSKKTNARKQPRKKAAPSKLRPKKQSSDDDLDFGRGIKNDMDTDSRSKKPEREISSDDSNFGGKKAPAQSKKKLSNSESDFSLPEDDPDSDFGVTKPKGKKRN